MKLFWLKTRFTWIASSSEFENIPNAKTVKRVRPELRRFCSHLLAIGGERVVIPLEDAPYCSVFLELGEVTPYTAIHIQNGEERACHRNSALLWLGNKQEYKIVTGFGLSDDNIWRRHSWVAGAQGDLIETTLPRAVYFGIVLEDEGATRFAEAYT